MSKTKNPTNVVYLNGEKKAQTTITPSGTYSYYNMSEPEKQAYEYAQNEFAKNLSEANVFSPEVREELNKTVDTFIQAGTEDINEIYEPILLDLQNDIASRFGNLDNSIFMDDLKTIEETRGDAIEDLAVEAQMLSQDLINNELLNRYDFLDLLNNYQQQVNSNLLDTVGMSGNLAQANGNYYSNRRRQTSDILSDAASKILQTISMFKG